MREDLPWWDTYQFIHDRIRAIKQDLVIQGITGVSVLNLHVAIVRFYTYAQYRLVY